MSKICVTGLGYIGLPTALLFTSKGHQIIGVDNNPSVVRMLSGGNVHIREPGLGLLLNQGIKDGNLRISGDIEAADVHLICVPTPCRKSHSADLTYVEAATRRIAPYLRGNDLVILESTVPVGTTEWVCRIIAELRPDLRMPDQPRGDGAPRILVAHCPERVLPGKIMQEITKNDRIIGGVDTASAEGAVRLYASVVEGKLLATDARTAEACKLAENSFRDVNIAFANSLSLACDRLGIDARNLIQLANLHPRVNILNPGPGVGGHCLAVDPWFLIQTAPEETRLLREARRVNDSMPEYYADKIRREVSQASNRAVACLGLAFKANVDDLRESPALAIVDSIAKDSDISRILVVEPNIEVLPAHLTGYAEVELTSLENALDLAGVVVLLVDHNEFRAISSEALVGKRLVDTRGTLMQTWKRSLAV